MAGNDCSNSAQIELLSYHLEAIATACGVLKQAGHRLVADGADEVLSTAVISLAERAGWRADAGLALLNKGQCFGEFEVWVSSPCEAEARKKLAAEGVSYE